MSRETLRNLRDVLDTLFEAGLPALADPADHSLTVVIRQGELEGELLVVWVPDSGVVQVLQALNIPVPPERQAAVATLIVGLNHLLSVPGFGLNLAEGLPYFRLSLLAPDGAGLPRAQFEAACLTVLASAADHAPALAAVAQGADPQPVLARLEAGAPAPEPEPVPAQPAPRRPSPARSVTPRKVSKPGP